MREEGDGGVLNQVNIEDEECKSGDGGRQSCYLLLVMLAEVGGGSKRREVERDIGKWEAR